MSSHATEQQTLAAVYDQGAAAYEKYWAPQLYRHAADLVATVPEAEPTPRVVVDVATGSGALVPDLVRLAGPGGRVVALDRSLGILRRAPSTAARVQADAMRLPLATDSVDLVVQAFVLFLLADPDAAVSEAARVLRSGGWMLVATWGTQLGTAADVVLREELDRAGAPAFPALPRSDDATDSAEDMTALLADEFVEIRTTARPLEARFTADSAVAMRTGCGPTGWRFGHLDRAGRTQVLARTSERLRDVPGDRFVDPSEVLLTTARRR